MFYPEESLKRGGRFYLCWVADSWPLRFAAITHRQLWSQDIRKLCHDLLEVMTNESGRPSNRFSLRLSSQLLRGLVRLYERKVTVFLGDLCMMNAHVFKHANKKSVLHETVIVGNIEHPVLQLPQLTVAVPEEPENEPRVEELIQNSGNVVSNIQDITLKESAIPDFRIPPNDGFGEEHPDQALQLLGDRTVEMMLLQPDTSVVQHSGLDLPLDTTDKSHDKSRALHDPPQMERISEHDVTMFRKSTGEELLPGGYVEKDIPEIPEIPLPETPAPPPQPEKQVTEQLQDELEVPKDVQPTKSRKELVTVDTKLEELEEGQPQAKKRRAKNKLIIDKKIKIGAGFLRARIDNPSVELRCEDSSDDIVDIRVPWEMYIRRPAHVGCRFASNISHLLTRMYQRNCVVMYRLPLTEREEEVEVVEQPRHRRTRSTLEKIVEDPEPQIPVQQVPKEALVHEEIEKMTEVDINMLNLSGPLPRVSVQEPLDFHDLPTQKLETLSQAQKRKETSAHEISPKRPRMSGYVSFRESQSQQLRKEVEDPVIVDKENIPPDNEQQTSQIRHSVRNVSAMLQEAGLADVQPPEEQTAEGRRKGSDRSETPLGSLDRTKVSLGDSVNTSDSQRFIRNQWGIEGTMMKILTSLKAGMSPVTVENLIAKGPVISGYRSIIAARCFNSILKLKQHQFIKIDKHSETLEIRDIFLGPMFDGLE